MRAECSRFPCRYFLDCCGELQLVKSPRKLAKRRIHNCSFSPQLFFFFKKKSLLQQPSTSQPRCSFWLPNPCPKQGASSAAHLAALSTPCPFLSCRLSPSWGCLEVLRPLHPDTIPGLSRLKCLQRLFWEDKGSACPKPEAGKCPRL